MESYNEIQSIWIKNIRALEERRNRLNIKGLSQNYKANNLISQKGKDITLIERADKVFEQKRNTDLIRVAFH